MSIKYLMTKMTITYYNHAREYEIRKLIPRIGLYTHQGIFSFYFLTEIISGTNAIGQIAGGADASSKHLKTKVSRAPDGVRG